MTLKKALQLRNVRNVLRGHWAGAIIGGIVGYLAYTSYKKTFTFAIAPLETTLSFINAEKDVIIIISLVVVIGAFIGAFIQAKGRY